MGDSLSSRVKMTGTSNVFLYIPILLQSLVAVLGLGQFNTVVVCFIIYVIDKLT